MMKTLKILLMVILSVSLLCGCGSAEKQAKQEQQQLIDAASPVCSGTGYAEAAAYSASTALHPIVILNEKSAGLGWYIPATGIPETWTPAQPQGMELVTCITTEKTLVETCPYKLTDGETVYVERDQYHLVVTVYEAQSGNKLADTVIDGSMPNNCGEQVKFKEGETRQFIYGSLPSTADAVAWLRSYVEGQTVAANTATPAPTSTPAATPTPSADDLVAEGIQQREAGQLEDAIATFQKAIELDPNDPDTQRNLGSSYGSLSEWEKAVVAYEKAIELNPDFGEAYGDLAAAYVNTGKLTEAIAVGKKAIELAPEYAAAYNNLGFAYGTQGDLEQATALFQKALQIDPEDAMAHYNLGFIHTKQGNLEQAIVEFREAIRIDPDYLDARQNLGAVLVQQNLLDEAIAEWQVLLELDPAYTKTYRSLGRVYAKQGKYAEAIAAYETYLTLATDASDKADIEQEIAKLKEAETTYRNAAGGYSFPRPAGWYYEESKALVKFSESATAFKNAPDSAPLLMFQAGPANELAANLDVAVDADAATYLQAMMQSVDMDIDEPEAGTIAGYPAAIAAIANESPAMRGAIVIVLIDGRVVNGLALSPQDQWEAFRPIFLETVKGLTFAPPEYRNDTGGYSLNYPGNWSYEENDEMVSFALTEAALEDSEKAALEEGLLIAFDASPASELADKLKVENRDDPKAFVTAMAESFDAQVGNVETGEIAGYPVAYANISGAYLDVPYTGGLVAILVDDRLIGGYAMAAPDMWGTMRPVFSDMLDSMTFFEP